MYIVEGNIGAGKSTFLKLLAQQLPEITVSFEPRQHWQDDTKQDSLLDRFYTDPKRWAYTMETMAMICRVKEHVQEQNHTQQITIVERSVYSGHYCFAHNDYASGYMTPLEWELYNQWFTFMVQRKCKVPRGFIYLKTDPHVALDRIIQRDRSSESTISLTYLQDIHQFHERFLIEKDGILPELAPVPVCIIDGNLPFETDAQIMANLSKKIAKFALLHTPQAKPDLSQKLFV